MALAGFRIYIFFNVIMFISVGLSVIFVGLGGSLDATTILDFVDSGHDLILAADESASDFIRNIGTEFGVAFDEVSVDIISHYIEEMINLFLIDYLINNGLGFIGYGY